MVYPDPRTNSKVKERDDSKMRVYSTRKFLSLIAASIVVAVIIAYTLTSIVPFQFTPSPGYTLSSNPASLQVTPGGAGSYTLRFTSQNGFSGPLRLAARVPNAPNSLAVSLTPSVTLTSGGSASATLQVATNPVTPAGSYAIAIDETSGMQAHTDIVNLDVIGFTVSANPASLDFPITATGRATISITAVNGFSGQVNLVASSSATGPTVIISPNTLYVPDNGNATSTLIVQSSAQGRFDVTVTVIGNQFYQSVSLPVTVTSTSTTGDFNIATIPSSFSINPGTFRNVIVEITGQGDCGCLVTLSVSTQAGFDYGIGPYIVQVPAGGSVNSTLTLTAYAGGNNAAPGTYAITVTGTSLSIVHSTQLTAIVTTNPVPDLTLDASPLFVHVTQGGSNSTTITIKSIAGLSGTISLAASTTPVDPNIGLSLNPPSVQLSPDGTATSNLTITATSTASLLGYNFTVTGTIGTLTRGVYGNILVSSATPLAAAPLEVNGPGAGGQLTTGLTSQVSAQVQDIIEAESFLGLALATTFIAATSKLESSIFSNFIRQNLLH
jgi:uncharacterized membrane protein